MGKHYCSACAGALNHELVAHLTNDLDVAQADGTRQSRKVECSLHPRLHPDVHAQDLQAL